MEKPGTHDPKDILRNHITRLYVEEIITEEEYEKLFTELAEMDK